MQDAGVQALPIVSLICFLVGLILAFIDAIQLKLFGAQIYVADLVGIAMVRLMAAIMTGIVMARRTGGAFAAHLGTMEVNQEIDALRTTGISPMEFLVLPRMLALALMMPLLCLHANVMGILGFRTHAEQLGQFYVRNQAGEAVPLGGAHQSGAARRAGIHHALQPLPVGADQCRQCPGLQLRPGDEGS